MNYTTSYKTKTMKKGIIVLAVILSSCTASTDKNLNDLISKRDSLQKVQYKMEKELNHIDLQIAELDTSIHADDQKVMKKITMQKNRVAATHLKIKSLENKMTPAGADNLIPVSVKEILQEEFNHYIIAYGKVEADNYALISPEMGGQIKAIHVKEGQQVAKGQLLVSLNTDAVQKQIEGLRSSLELAHSTFEKLDTLWQQGIGSEIQYLGAKSQKETLEAQLESLEAQQRMAQIRAPFQGTVDKIFQKKGEIAGPGFPVVEFVNLNKITIKADVSEKFLGMIKKGQVVNLAFGSLPDLSIETPIRRLSSVINNASRTFEIELSIDNRNELIKPNMVSTIQIKDFTADDAIVIPSLVIRKDITGNYVYVVQNEDMKHIVKKRYVESALSYEDNTMITEGLKIGDKVIVAGYHLVSSGVPVKIIQ